MLRMRIVSVAVLLAAGAAVLSACGTGIAGQATSSPASSTAAQATLATDLHYEPGTAKEHNAPANTGDFYAGPSNSPAVVAALMQKRRFRAVT